MRRNYECLQALVFGPSRRYMSKIMFELPVLVTQLDGREDVLIIQTYLVDAEIPFLCGKQTLENWNFKIDGRAKILEIQSKMDGSMMKLKMIDTSGGHYGIVLETRMRKESDLLFVENIPGDVCLLFLEDARGELFSFRAMRKVHKINQHKSKEQLVAAYNNGGGCLLN